MIESSFIIWRIQTIWPATRTRICGALNDLVPERNPANYEVQIRLDRHKKSIRTFIDIGHPQDAPLESER